MSEQPLSISNLNDFIFCPVSIYFHSLDINNHWIKRFDDEDSIYIFQLSSSCKIQKFGFARHEDTDLLIIQ